MTLLVLRRGEHRRMPWQNGGGNTYEVARAPDGAGSTAFTWRISIAEVVNDGPFSSLPGIDRIIVLIEGTQMALTMTGFGDCCRRSSRSRSAATAGSPARCPAPPAT